MAKRRTTPGATLYRYRNLSGEGFKHTQDIFLRRRLYLPLFSQLNDPTEGVYRNESRVIVKPGKTYGYAKESPLRHPTVLARVVSFSEDHRNSLMWSHYADYHRGICIGFRRDRIEQLADILRVRYRTRVPTLPEAASNKTKAEAGLLAKSKEWEYEREWRIVRFSESEFIDFPPDSIRTVLFGVRTPRADREWVCEWLDLSNSKATLKRVVFSGAAARMRVLPYAPGDEW